MLAPDHNPGSKSNPGSKPNPRSKSNPGSLTPDHNPGSKSNPGSLIPDHNPGSKSNPGSQLPPPVFWKPLLQCSLSKRQISLKESKFQIIEKPCGIGLQTSISTFAQSILPAAWWLIGKIVLPKPIGNRDTHSVHGGMLPLR